MGDLVSPIVMMAIVGNIFFTETLKKKYNKLPSFIVSIIGSLISSFGVSNLDILKILPSIQSFVLNSFVIASASWGLYTWVLSRFITKKEDTGKEQIIPIPPEIGIK